MILRSMLALVEYGPEMGIDAREDRARMDIASYSSDEAKASEDPYCQVMDPNVTFAGRY